MERQRTIVDGPKPQHPRQSSLVRSVHRASSLQIFKFKSRHGNDMHEPCHTCPGDARRAPKGSEREKKSAEAETETGRWERRSLVVRNAPGGCGGRSSAPQGWSRRSWPPAPPPPPLLRDRHAASEIQRETCRRRRRKERVGERTMEGAAGEAEARERRRHVVVERDDADAEDRGGRPRRAGLRRLRGRHGRRGAEERVPGESVWWGPLRCGCGAVRSVGWLEWRWGEAPCATHYRSVVDRTGPRCPRRLRISLWAGLWSGLAG